MKSYIDQLERLGHPVTLNLGVSLILVGLSKEYDSFVQNYNMHNMGMTINELHAMLKLHEETLPKKVDAPALHAIRAGKVKKNKNKKPSKATKGVHGKGKGKMAYASVAPSYPPKPKNPPPPKKDNPAKDAICHHCGEVGHWRRNCPIYLTELLKKKQLSQGASTSGIFTIELYYFPSTSWVYDTGCGTHICNAIQGLRGSKKLNPGALSLYTGNGQRAAVKAIGNYCFEQLSYAPSITRGIILVSRLYDDGFINRFELNNAIFVSKNNVIYFRAIPRDGVYEIEMSCSNTNDSSMYAVSNKRAKLNLDSSL
ncbi:zinc finger, CCHC-type containing protein [Tanacetum coccineum]